MTPFDCAIIVVFDGVRIEVLLDAHRYGDEERAACGRSRRAPAPRAPRAARPREHRATPRRTAGAATGRRNGDLLGEPGPFVRTPRGKDFSLPPPGHWDGPGTSFLREVLRP